MKSNIKGIYYRQDGSYIIKRRICNSEIQLNVYKPKYKYNVIKCVIELLDGEFFGFLEKFYHLDKERCLKKAGRTRRCISKNKEDMILGYSENQLNYLNYKYKEYYLCKQLGPSDIVRYIKEICETCCIEYGLLHDKEPFFRLIHEFSSPSTLNLKL